MATIFSETLTRLRKGAGFPTAYRFYHDNGGAPFFKVSYRNYLMMEQGRNLPVLGRLARIIMGMRIPERTPQARELTLAWLRTMAGDEAYADMLEPLLSQGTPPSASSPAEEALSRTLAEKKFHITEDQILASVVSFEAYKCFFVMEADSGLWTAEALAKALGIKKAEAEKALKSFLKVGLVKAEGKGGYRSKMVGQLVEYPAGPAFPQEVLAKLKDYYKRLETESSMEFGTAGMVRADADALRGFFPMLKSSVEASYAFSTTKATKKSAGFFVIGRVHRLWNF
jgi:predicted transcriptional regulator